MKKTIFFISVAILILIAISFPILRHFYNGATFDRWINYIQRPGYILMAKDETPTLWVGIFNAGKSQIAICTKESSRMVAHTSTIISITDEDGKDLQDWSAENRNGELDRNINCVLATYSDNDGAMYPITPG